MSNILDASIAKKFDFIVKQNQTFNATITILDDTGLPINLNGASVKMSVRNEHSCNSGCDDYSFDSFGINYKQDFTPTIGGGSMNVLQFFDTIILKNGLYKYDLLVEYPNGQKQYLLVGTFKVKKSYTTI